MTTRVVEVAPERYDRWRARFDENNPDGPQRVVGVSRLEADPLAVLLVRRGGYAVGVAVGDRLTEHKVGTRYVQSRTAAGGWSQQRFARRRSNQADELVGAVTEHAVRLLRGSGARGLVLGGDRALAEAVLDDARLGGLRDLARIELYDLPDPRFAVLEKAVERARAVRVTIEE
ncbi:acVLRF1 family peptidyl-tRNA hydrolase [Phycicoccus sonneratiae]|uniref:Actinobacteria/chloroflexi VLRF1 release factor domain-containing protein n=1 Tax=Phycicoccus sonneratiae TaxID=2807628 RepID=A0ABS2CI52_9MICO|nr:acVLRF1 family peptidyl-tRNA hydrolase [Phycicoccus sonneraticus]MBM6399557.1 hypothetical protein [Phycicoccus sonneraticus]